MDLQALRSAVQGANSLTSGAPILGGAPELQKFYDINAQLPQSAAGAQALASNANVESKIQQQALTNKINDLKAKASGEGYTRTKAPDGGWNFFDNQGNSISAYQFANATGNNPADVLKDSENPIDIQYNQDYNNLQDFFAASMSGDKEAKALYLADNPGLDQMSPKQVLDSFKQAYPTVYGGTNTGVPTGKTFIPNLGALKNNAGFAAGGDYSSDFGEQ